MEKKYTLGQRINGVINLLAYFFIIVLFISFVFLAEIPEGGSWIDTKGGPVIILIFLIFIIKFILNKIVNKFLK
tara:strand:+ start:17878 stop:18099 length:222 start_codon:yes stop_codon:yes gene_type:complete